MTGTPKRQSNEIDALRERAASLEAQLAAVHSSVSWRSTSPIRAVSDSPRLRRFFQNTRSALELPGRLAAGKVVRAGNALLPFYQRYAPLRVKRVVPRRLRLAVQRWIMTEPWNVQVDYAEWIVRNDTLNSRDRLLIRNHIASFENRPKFSILMPIDEVPLDYLQQAIVSILNQLYQDWELCIVCGESTKGEVRSMLEDYGQEDGRVRLHSRPVSGGASHCVNAAVEMATGNWIVLANTGGILSEHALYLLAEAVNSRPDVTLIYSDHDYIDAEGKRVNPYFKPDWDYDLFLGRNYIDPLCACRTDLVRPVKGVRDGFEGAENQDFALRILEAAPGAEIHHIPFVLCHRRATGDASSQASPTGALDAAQRAVNEHFERTGKAALALPVSHLDYLRIKWRLPAERPPVSVIIPTKDQRPLLQVCLDGLMERTDYGPLEIVIVDNGSTEPDALAFLSELRKKENVKVVEDSGPFNFSRLVNLGVASSSGEIVVLLNNDVEVINSDWLDEMVSHALRPDVGAVGAKLYYRDDTLQHGGVILGVDGIAVNAHRFVPRESQGYFGRLNLTHGLSCVTAACLATRRTIYESLGGFNEQDLAISYNDVDFCLRLRQAGYRIIWTPHAELYHYEGSSREAPKSADENAARNRVEAMYMRKHWGPLLDNDPYYNPNFSLRSPPFKLGAASRAPKPWRRLGYDSPR
jgi:GT2 family glycosyltransferase